MNNICKSWDFKINFDIGALWSSESLKEDLQSLIKLFKQKEKSFIKKYGQDEYDQLEEILNNINGFEPDYEELEDLEWIISDLYDWCDFNKRVWLNN